MQFADETVKAVPYDMPILGYDTDNIGTLRLWQAEAKVEFDFDLFNEQKYEKGNHIVVIDICFAVFSIEKVADCDTTYTCSGANEGIFYV